MEITFKTAFPDVCPPSLAHLKAGDIGNGCFFPSGSVAGHYYKLQRKKDVEKFLANNSTVYFIRSAAGGPVKIGIAKCIVSRLSQLQTAHAYKLEVIATMQGGRSVETELHKRFAAYRLNGEWFEWCSEIESFVNSIQEPQKGDVSQ